MKLMSNDSKSEIESLLHSVEAKTIFARIESQFTEEDLATYTDLIAYYCNEAATLQRIQQQVAEEDLTNITTNSRDHQYQECQCTNSNRPETIRHSIKDSESIKANPSEQRED